MLKIINKRQYFVVPSWAEESLPYKWKDLESFLSNPMGCYLLDKYYDYQELGYSLDVQPFKLFDGIVGGGIVIADFAQHEKWLPINILGKNACLATPGSITGAFDYFPVLYVEPWDESGWQFGLGKKAKNYYLDMTVEHADCMGDSIGWLFWLKKGPRKVKAFDEVSGWASEFGLTVKGPLELPKHIARLSPKWQQEERDYVWFEVDQGDSDDFGFHFAVMQYIGLHLASLSRKITVVNFLAQIEGKPQLILKPKQEE